MPEEEQYLLNFIATFETGNWTKSKHLELLIQSARFLNSQDRLHRLTTPEGLPIIRAALNARVWIEFIQELAHLRCPMYLICPGHAPSVIRHE